MSRSNKYVCRGSKIFLKHLCSMHMKNNNSVRPPALCCFLVLVPLAQPQAAPCTPRFLHMQQRADNGTWGSKALISCSKAGVSCVTQFQLTTCPPLAFLLHPFVPSYLAITEGQTPKQTSRAAGEQSLACFSVFS